MSPAPRPARQGRKPGTNRPGEGRPIAQQISTRIWFLDTKEAPEIPRRGVLGKQLLSESKVGEEEAVHQQWFGRIRVSVVYVRANRELGGLNPFTRQAK